MKIVATTIGTRVYYGFEQTPGVRPTSLADYVFLEDCTSHPDFNPERDQIETTTLAQTNNKTYTQGLKDFGTLEFGFNLTQDIVDEFLDETTGVLAVYKSKMAENKGMWLCIDIPNINKSIYIPVEPQDFGLPAGETNSKYDLVIRFNTTGDAVWAADLTSTYTVTNVLSNSTSSNAATTGTMGGSYEATITADSGYTLEGATVSITMGGSDITSTAYTAGAISISNVTGNLVITVTAVEE